MCDVHEGKLLDFYCKKHNISGCSICMKLTHGSCKNVQPRSAQDVTGGSSADIATKGGDEVEGKTADKTTKGGYKVGGRSADKPTKGDSEVGRNSADIAYKSDDKVGGKSTDKATKGGDKFGGKSVDKATKGGDKVGGKSADIAYKSDDQVGGKSTDKATKGGDKVGGKSADKATKGGDEVAGNSADIATEGVDKVGGQLKIQSNDDEVAGARSKPRRLYSVTGKRDINVRIDSDTETCFIWDICQLPDGRLLMTDYMNQKLKLLDQSYTVIGHCYVSGPISVCLCDKEACVGRWDRKLQFVSIQEKMEISRTVKLDHACSRLAYLDGELYVSDGQANTHVYNRVGNQLRVYNTGTVVGEYFNTEYLTVSMDGRQLYMTHGIYLICVDRQSGEVIWSVKGDNESEYRGVCVDKDNNLMVCDGVSGEIVQYSGDGEKIRVIVRGLKEPASICFDQNSKTILVGKFVSDVIKVLNFK